MMVELPSFESIKKAMLQHDHLFKQQVKELHRLYSVQRMLMAGPEPKACKVDSPHDLPAGHQIGLTKPGCFDLERDATAGEEDAEIELTLSIGNMKNSNKRMKRKHSDSSEVQQQQSNIWSGKGDATMAL